MPKSFQQKLKILYLMRVFSEKTDEAHPMSVKDLISYLESLGIHAERKTIYDDIETCVWNGYYESKRETVRFLSCKP